MTSKKKAETKGIVAEKETAVKKTAVLKENIVLQYAGKELGTADILKRVKTHWTKDLKHKVGDMQNVTLYLKPEDNRAYFVINDTVTGSVEI